MIAELTLTGIWDGTQERSSAMHFGEHANQHGEKYCVDDLLVDIDAMKVVRDGNVLPVKGLTFLLLTDLIRHAPNMRSRDDLGDAVWNGAMVSEQTLKQRIRLLRAALDDDGHRPKYVATIRGRGYRMICPVQRIHNDSQSPESARTNKSLINDHGNPVSLSRPMWLAAIVVVIIVLLVLLGGAG